MGVLLEAAARLWYCLGWPACQKDMQHLPIPTPISRRASSQLVLTYSPQVGMLEGRLTRQLIISLLNHIRAFSDWAQCFVLELVATYQPASEEERFDILEVRWMGLGGSVARGVWWRLFGW